MIRTKGRRKIAVGGCDYVWYVCADHDSAEPILHVASMDKKMNVQYALSQQPPSNRHLTVIGKEFRGIADMGHIHRRFLCPEFGQGGDINPASVRTLIEWCLEARGHVVEIDCRNNQISHFAELFGPGQEVDEQDLDRLVDRLKTQHYQKVSRKKGKACR